MLEKMLNEKKKKNRTRRAVCPRPGSLTPSIMRCLSLNKRDGMKYRDKKLNMYITEEQGCIESILSVCVKLYFV